MRLTLPFILIVFLSGCVFEPVSPVDDYAARLARALTLDEPVYGESGWQRLPRPRALQLPVSEVGIDLLDFLALGDCRLQAVVAERNSSLGRLAGASTRLGHELEFLAAGYECLPGLAAQADLAAELEAVLAQKTRELPRVIFTATLGGDAFRAFWQSQGQPTTVDVSISQALAALNGDIQRWLSGDYAVDQPRLDDQLRIIALGNGGDIVAAWAELARILTPLNRALEQRREAGPLCYPGMKNPDADIFRRVVMNYFVAGVQRDVADLNRVSFEQLDAVASLERLLADVETPAYQQWREGREQVQDLGRQVMRDHVQALQPFMEECGFIPGA